ncbi:MAG: hypothetical protein B7X41_10860 [Microbacterium sp. 14-71-5]|nr:MAG: hypothetical protein B7X41_10860 [Microbacterium sp. 14-71-5]
MAPDLHIPADLLPRDGRFGCGPSKVRPEQVATLAAVGELSLAGEVRPVTQAAQRRSEAARLGYAHVIDDRSATLRGALGDVKAHRAPRRLDDEVPAF